MGYSEIYKRLGKKYDVKTALFRFGIISNVWGKPYDDEVRILNDEHRSTIGSTPMTETLERLLFLYGAGIIDFKAISRVVNVDMKEVDVADVIADAEEFVLGQYKEYQEVRISSDMLTQIIVCCAVARRYMPEDKFTFADAKSLCSLPTVKIVDDLVRVTDRELLELMVKNKEKFGNYMKDDEKITITPEDNEHILTNDDVVAGDVDGKYYPIALSPKRVLLYDKIEKLLYGKEFLGYCSTYGYTLDDDYEDQYKRYMERIKCRFSVRSYHRKRNVCGDIFNNFDYCSNINNTAVQPDDEDTVEITPTTHKSDRELIFDAMMKFCEDHEVKNDSVLEIHNQGNIKLYVYHNCQYKEISRDTFRNTLFDYETIWKKIQDYSTTHGIVVNDGKIVLPVEFIRKFPEKDQPFVNALLKEQYERQIDRNNKRVISTLSELMTSASEQMAEQQALDAEQEALKKDKANKKANRKPNTEG